jgi:hypothetical protein
VSPTPASAFSFLNFIFFTTASLESPAGEEGRIQWEPSFFSPFLPNSSDVGAVVKNRFFSHIDEDERDMEAEP